MSLSDAHGNTGSSRIKACFIRAANKTRFIRRGTCATTRVRHGPCLAGPRIPPPGVGGTGADLDRLLRCLVLPCNRHDSTFPVFSHGASMTRQPHSHLSRTSAEKAGSSRRITGGSLTRAQRQRQRAATATPDGAPTTGPKLHRRRRTRAPLPTQGRDTEVFLSRPPP